LKSIYNFIAYSKNKKIVIKSIMTKCQGRTIEGVVLKFYKGWRKTREKKRIKRKKTNNHQQQTVINLGKHVAPPCKECLYLPKDVIKDGVWWLDSLSCVI
jgi:hypothetical protein